MNDSLPVEFAELQPKIFNVRRIQAGQYTSSCPSCRDLGHSGGQVDRFVMWVKSKNTGAPAGWCRRCGYWWTPDTATQAVDQKTIQKLTEQAARAEAARAEERRAKLAQFSTRELWEELHERLSAENRAWWRDRGIPDNWQDFWKLGFIEGKQFSYNDEPFYSDAYTIPKFDLGFKPTNIDYRLTNFPPGAGKYRMQYDLQASAFFSRPDAKAFPDEVFVVEGSIKAMNTALRVRPETGLEFVIGLPSCSSWAGVAERLKESCGRVWVIFDPDAIDVWGRKFAQRVGKSARLVWLPVKPDDAFLEYGMTPQMFASYLAGAEAMQC